MRQRRQSICISVFETSWGWMGVSAGPTGIGRVILPRPERAEVVSRLAEEFPSGHNSADSGIAGFQEQCREYFDGGCPAFQDVPCILPSPRTLDGTILRECRRIPPGTTLSYGLLAKNIGRPAAARAVAAALGRNPVPLVVPCHRVIMADGSIGGFSVPRGGALKRRLLDHERRLMNSGSPPRCPGPSSTG